MSSFIMKQEHSMLTLERDSLRESLNEFELEPKTKTERSMVQKISDRLSKITSRLNQIESVFEAEASVVAAAATEKAQAAAEAQRLEEERRALLPDDIYLGCRDCKNEFLFSGEDQDRFTQNSYPDPIRCPECRQARKNQRENGISNRVSAPTDTQEQDEPVLTICCKDCSSNFDFSAANQRKYAEKNYETPVRCEPCRQKKKNSLPKGLVINCKNCLSDFTVSVGAQKFNTEKGFPQPVRCPECRTNRKTQAKAGGTEKRK